MCTRSDLEPLLQADEVVVRRDVDDWFTVRATDVTVKREGESLTIVASRESKSQVYVMAPDPSRTFRSTGLGRSRLDRFLATTLDLASDALPFQRDPAHHRASERVQIVIASASGKISLTATDASWAIATSECASTLPRAAAAFQQEAFRTLIGPDILGSAPRTANQWQWVQPAD